MGGTNYLIVPFLLKLILNTVIISFCLHWLSKEHFKKTLAVTKITLTKNSIDFIRYMKGKSFLSHWLLRLHIRYIEQTNIRKYFPNASIKLLYLVGIIIFFLSAICVYARSKAIVMSVAIGVISLFIPLIILDSLRHYNLQRIRGDIVHFLSLLGQWYIVSEDIMKCFEKVSEQKLSEPLGTYIEDFVTQVRRGLDVSEALYILNRKVDSEFFSTFIVNIDQALSNRGDVGVMLKNLEDEAYQLQEELNRRNISTLHDKIIIYITMLSVIIIAYQLLVLNEITETFYFETTIGRILMVIFCILYLIGFFIATGLSKMEY